MTACQCATILLGNGFCDNEEGRRGWESDKAGTPGDGQPAGLVRWGGPLQVLQGHRHGLTVVLLLEDVAGGSAGHELPGLGALQLVCEGERAVALVVGEVDAAGVAHALPRHGRPAHAAVQAAQRLQLPLQGSRSTSCKGYHEGSACEKVPAPLMLPAGVQLCMWQSCNSSMKSVMHCLLTSQPQCEGATTCLRVVHTRGTDTCHWCACAVLPSLHPCLSAS